MVKNRAKGPKTKYNSSGFTSGNDLLKLDVCEKYTTVLSDAANMAITENTKSQYRTAIKHIERIESKMNIDMSLPFDIGKNLNYVGFLLDDRQCSSKTVAQYLSGIRMLHLCKGMDVSSLRPPIIDLILKGREHWDNVNKTLLGKPKRIPVTVKVLKFIKRALLETELSNEKKLRLWAICCLMWNGSLRVHEVLSRTKTDYDPLTTLLRRDVEIVNFQEKGKECTLLRIHLKSPKEKRIGNGVKLEIFANGTFCCPVRAWLKWIKVAKNCKDNFPVFLEDNLCFTGKEFNKILTTITKNVTDGTDGVIRPHSFRSGVAS